MATTLKQELRCSWCDEIFGGQDEMVTISLSGVGGSLARHWHLHLHPEPCLRQIEKCAVGGDISILDLLGKLVWRA